MEDSALYDDTGEGGRFWRFWTLCCASGELLGLALAAVVFVLAERHLGPLEDVGVKVGMLSAMVLAGVLEGSTLGLLQWTALRHRFPALPAGRWIGITAVVAALGWVAGSMGPVIGAAGDSLGTTSSVPGIPTQLLLAGLFGLGAGALFGAFQWMVLRHYSARAGRWILANALGWAVALPLIYLGASLPPAGTSVGGIALLAAGAGIVAGVAVGGITGGFLLRMAPLGEAVS